MASWSMSVPAHARQLEEARAWLAKADEDRAAVTALLAPQPPLLGVAAYHCQQAAEKLLKGLLTAHAVPFRKTHDLDELAESMVVSRPDLAATVDPLRSRTTWSFAFRYPSIVGPVGATPVLGEIDAAVAELRRLREQVVAVLAEHGQMPEEE